MPTPNQQLEPAKPHHSLKPLCWIIPLVILAALTAGYFICLLDAVNGVLMIDVAGMTNKEFGTDSFVLALVSVIG